MKAKLTRKTGRFTRCLCACTLLLTAAARADLWCTGYYPGWEQNSTMPASAVDFGTLTHVVHFSLVPNADGSLNSTLNGLSPTNVSDLVAAAHAANRKAIVCVGGANTSFQSATSDEYITNFVGNLTNFMAQGGYDGIDVDWEPLNAGDGTQFTNLVTRLRNALNAFSSPRLLTVALPPAAPVEIITAVKDKFDQINLMTYDLSGPYGGWVTWFDSAITNGGFNFPSTGGAVPSVDDSVRHFTTNGIAASKLGIGITFYAHVWSGGDGTTTGGVTAPRQSWATAPTMHQESFSEIMAANYPASAFHYDTNAQAAYISVDNAGSSNDKFISYDDERASQSKVSYARNRGLGGVIIWEIAQDYQTNHPAPLMNAVKRALAIPGALTAQRVGQNLTLWFNTAPLGSYRVQWKDDLNSPSWNTLIVTNMMSTGGVMQVTDPTPLNQVRRFYRINSP